MLLWVVDAAFPAASYMAVAPEGTTVRVSAPLGVPLRFKPKVYTFPEIEILDGVAFTVATPPEMDKAKSLTSNAPLPPFVLKTASLNVTAIVLLLLATVVPDTVGTTLIV